MVTDRDQPGAMPAVSIRVKQHVHGPLEQIEMVGRSPVLPRPFSVSVFRLGDTLIDTGSPHAIPQLLDALRDRPPRRVLLTHQHEDHAGGIAALRLAFGQIPVFAPKLHHAIIENPPIMPPYRAIAWGQPEPATDLETASPGDRFEDAGLALEAVPTPGHTPGHLAYVIQLDDRALAISGDLYLGRRPKAAWYEAAADDLRDSARLLADVADTVTLVPSHGPAREQGRERLHELADWVDREIDTIEGLTQSLGTRDLDVITRARFGQDDPHAAFSGGEFSYRCFVRSVLDPVRTLPAQVPVASD